MRGGGGSSDPCLLCAYKEIPGALQFAAMAVDTFGGWHSRALQMLSSLGRQLGIVTGREEEETVRHLLQRLAVVLVRDNMNR